MSTPEEFAAACKETARSMRRLPAELRRALGRQVKDEVAEPLARDIRQAWRGPHGPALSAATKTRVSTDPQIVIGGSRRVVRRGGANARQLVFGNEWGGGKRSQIVKKSARARAYRRRTTQQFPRQGQHAVYGTIAATLDKTFERWVKIVDKVIDDVIYERSTRG